MSISYEFMEQLTAITKAMLAVYGLG